MKSSEVGNLIGNGSHFQDVILQSRGREDLIEKNQDVQTDKKEGYIRKAISRVLVFEGYEHYAMRSRMNSLEFIERYLF